LSNYKKSMRWLASVRPILGKVGHISAQLTRQPQTAALHTTRCCLNENIINIQDEEDWQARVVLSKVPVLVDFHATWCGPCKLLGPRLESVISELNGDVIMAKVDIDEQPDIAIQHKVSAVPTVLAMKDGAVVDSFIGIKDGADLKAFVRKLTGK